MLTIVPYFDILTHYVCLFCAHIVVNIMVLDVTGIQVRGLALNQV